MPGRRPLGLYVFAKDRASRSDRRRRPRRATLRSTIARCSRWCAKLPFGGVGNSGMGKYHGEWGFRAYTNARGVLHRSTSFDPQLRYPPYSENTRLIGWLVRLS